MKDGKLFLEAGWNLAKAVQSTKLQLSRNVLSTASILYILIELGILVRYNEDMNADNREHTFIVLKICTDSEDGKYANSIISGWKISEKRLQSYIRNKEILYKRK